MKFKDFLKEEQDKGLMGYGVPYRRKPSDGQPFAKYLSSVAGASGDTGGGSPMGGAAPMFMKKKMKKA